jgi:hypothetical protein
VLLGDEWRSIENRNPLPDGLGKRPLVTVNTVPLDRIDEQIDAKPKPARTGSAGRNGAASAWSRGTSRASVRREARRPRGGAESRRLARLIEANLEG